MPTMPAWLRPVLGPSGMQHPAAWIAPAVALFALAPPWLILIGEAMLVGILWALVARPIPRFTRATVSASVLLLAAFLLVTGIVSGMGAGTGAAPDLHGYRDGRLIPARPLAARLGATSTHYDVDAPPELLNRAEAERELTERLFDAGAAETRDALVGVWVRADGTVDPRGMEPSDEAHGDFVTAAAPGLAVMRFQPLTRDGVPIPAIVWVGVDLVRSSAVASPGAPLVTTLRR
jgi:hypothetical protein